jgi:hypothetical protein
MCGLQHPVLQVRESPQRPHGAKRNKSANLALHKTLQVSIKGYCKQATVTMKWLFRSPFKTDGADAEKQLKSRRNINCCDYDK